MSGSQVVQVELWMCPSLWWDLRISSLHMDTKASGAERFWWDQSAQIKAVPGTAGCHLLPPGLRHQLPRRQRRHLHSRQTRAFVSKSKQPYLGEPLFHTVIWTKQEVCVFFTLVLKWAFGLLFRMLGALVKSASLIFFLNKFSTRFTLLHYIYILVITCTYIALSLYTYDYISAQRGHTIMEPYRDTYIHFYLFILIDRPAIFTPLC